MNVRELGATILFKKLDGTVLLGTVEGRNWAFNILLSYSVKGDDGKRYSVNANDFCAGHPY